MKLDKISAAIVVQYNYCDYKVIKVNYGGNPAWTGALLNAKYQNLFQVEKLLKEGDLIYLAERLYPRQYQRHEYIIAKGQNEKNYLQPRVACSLYRDLVIMSKGKPMEVEKVVAKQYECLSDIANECKVKILYVYNADYKMWYTYRKISKDNVKLEDKINYSKYILNLLYTNEIKTFTKENKEWLKERGMIVYY